MRKEISRSSYASPRSAAAAPQRVPLPKRARLWVVCDEEASLRHLNALLREDDAVVTKWTELWTTRMAVQDVEVVVVDVGPAHLAGVLKLLREDLGCNQSAILVNTRANAGGNLAPQLSGVLPQYRAMACPWKDLLRLTQTYLRGVMSERPVRSLL